MKLTKSGFSWLRDVAGRVTEAELRALLRAALDVAGTRRASVVGKVHLEAAWTKMNGGGQ